MRKCISLLLSGLLAEGDLRVGRLRLIHRIVPHIPDALLVPLRLRVETYPNAR